MKPIVIIPAYNEADSIVSVVESVADQGYQYVVVNDGSKDDTKKVCEDNNLNYIDLRNNLGIGGAVQTGHKYASRYGFEIDIQFDGDGQHEATYISRLIEPILSGEADLVIGSRFLEKTDGFQSTFMRRVGISWLSKMIRVFGDSKITDPTSGFRACGPRAIELFYGDYPVDYPEPESIITALKQGLIVKEVPVIMHERKEGVSSIGALSGIYYMLKVTLAIAILGISKRTRKGD